MKKSLKNQLRFDKRFDNRIKRNKFLAGILGSFAILAAPVSELAVSKPPENLALAASESFSSESVFENYLIASKLRTEETDSKEQAFLTVAQSSLSAPMTAEMKTEVKTVSASKAKTVSVPASLKTGKTEMTAYSSTPDQTDDSPFITANGTHVHDGTLACNFLPFGTKVKIPDYSGDKIYIVEDRMAKRFSHRMDLWFPSRAEAYQFGRRNLVYVVVE